MDKSNTINDGINPINIRNGCRNEIINPYFYSRSEVLRRSYYCAIFSTTALKIFSKVITACRNTFRCNLSWLCIGPTIQLSELAWRYKWNHASSDMKYIKSISSSTIFSRWQTLYGFTFNPWRTSRQLAYWVFLDWNLFSSSYRQWHLES